MRRFSTAMLALIASLLIAPAANASTRIFVRLQPPIRIVETRPVAPARGYVWRAGYHRWHEGRYEWVRGEWARPPYVRATWRSGRWSHERRGYYWVPGRWVRR
jgi:hypothetical protein